MSGQQESLLWVWGRQGPKPALRVEGRKQPQAQRNRLHLSEHLPLKRCWTMSSDILSTPEPAPSLPASPRRVWAGVALPLPLSFPQGSLLSSVPPCSSLYCRDRPSSALLIIAALAGVSIRSPGVLARPSAPASFSNRGIFLLFCPPPNFSVLNTQAGPWKVPWDEFFLSATRT